MLANAYAVKTRSGNTLTIRYPRAVVLAHYQTYGDTWPFLPDMRVNSVVEFIENRPAIVRKRILSGGGYDITLEFLPAPAAEKLPPWVANPRPRVQIEPYLPTTYAPAGGASEF